MKNHPLDHRTNFMKHLPALKSALFLATGIAIGRIFNLSFGPFIWTGIFIFLFISMIGLLRPHLAPRWLIPLIVITIGWLRINLVYWIPANHISYAIDHGNLTIKAWLIKDPELNSDMTRLWLKMDSVRYQSEFVAAKGQLILNEIASTIPDSLQYGDEILVSGHINRASSQRNPGGFNYYKYLSARNISGLMQISEGTCIQKTGKNKGTLVMRKIVYPSRRWINTMLDTCYQGEIRSLLKALILGDRTDLSDETRETFINIGIIHILAVSGLHVGFVFLILQTISGFIRLPRKYQTLFVILGLLFYMLITEAKPPVVRATIMACSYLFGKLLDRQTDPFNSLSVAGILLLILNPMMLFDTGFQLSFIAVFSILYFYPKWKYLPVFRQCNSWCLNHPVIKGIWVLFLVSLSAQVGTLPIVISAFNRFSIIGPVVNLLAIPIVGLIVAYGFTSLLIAPFSLWIAHIFGATADFLVHLLLFISNKFNQIPFTSLYLATPGIFQILLYISGILFIFMGSNVLWRKRLFFACLLGMNICVWYAVITNISGKLIYTQLDVGQGDAAVIQLPKNHTIVIDGGDKNPWFDAGKRILIPYLHHNGIRTIDAIILTHSHDDHVGGLTSVLKEFNVQKVYLSDSLYKSASMTEFKDVIQKKKIPLKMITAIDSMHLPGIKCYFLSPDQQMQQQENTNNKSIVTLIQFGKHQLLLMGDAELEAEQRIIQTVLPFSVDAVKIGHHGSNTSTDENFLNFINPEEAIISVERHNRFGHPHPKTISLLNRMGIPIHRTDKEGAVIFQSDGKHLSPVPW